MPHDPYAIPSHALQTLHEEMHLAQMAEGQGDHQLKLLAVTRMLRPEISCALAAAGPGAFSTLLNELQAARSRQPIFPISVSIPMGRSPRARHDVQRFWYHNPFARGLGAPPVGVAGYGLPRTERELAQDFLDASPDDGFVYLAPSPLGAKSHNVVIDISSLADRVRLTGQCEGYAIVHGDVPATAVRWVGEDLRSGPWVRFGALPGECDADEDQTQSEGTALARDTSSARQRSG